MFGLHHFHPYIDNTVSLLLVARYLRHWTDLVNPLEIEAPPAQPATKKRKTGPVSAEPLSAEQLPAVEDEVEEGDKKNGTAVPEDDGVDDYEEDSAEEDEVDDSAPVLKAQAVKGGAVPAENNLEEVEADEED